MYKSVHKYMCIYMHGENIWKSAYKVICMHYLEKGRKKEEKEVAKLKGKEKRRKHLKSM